MDWTVSWLNKLIACNMFDGYYNYYDSLIEGLKQNDNSKDDDVSLARNNITNTEKVTFLGEHEIKVK